MDLISQDLAMRRLWDPDRSLHGSNHVPSGPYTGIVVSADDVMDQQRLRVYCQSLRDDPRNPESIPYAVYCSPFAGTIDDPSMRRGAIGDTTEGAVSYGFHGVPEVGSQVLIMLINGDPNARVWIGSIPKHQQTNTIGHGRYIWTEEAYADGPFSGGTPGGSEGSPIEPAYSNLSEAFSSNKKAPEWLTRGADLQALSNQTKTEFTGSRDQRASEIQSIYDKHRGAGASLYKHYATVVTQPGNGWSGIRSSISRTSRVSRVYGMTTPGFHSLTMDDRHGNCRIRLRTTAGAQLILDDTNERIYLATAKGKSWFEMDQNGNVDVYSKRFSVHAEEDLNLTAGRDIRLHAGNAIHGVAGNKQLPADQQNISAPLPPGQIRFHSMDDMHLVSDGALRTYSDLETLITATKSMHLKTDDTFNLLSKSDMNYFAQKGSFLITAGGDIAGTATGNVAWFAGGTASLTAVVAVNVAALTGALGMSAGGGMLIKVMGGTFDMQSVDGGLNIASASNSFAMDQSGIRMATTGQILTQSENYEARTIPTTEPSTSMTDVPPSEDCSTNGPFPYLPESVNVDGRQIHSGIDNIARACFNAGWRGTELVTMVAVVGQESSFGRNVRGPARTDSGRSTANDPKWYPHCLGPFQMRCLRNPSEYSGLDAQRRVDVAMDLDAAAKWSYQLYKKQGFRPWSGYTDGGYRKYLSTAKRAVDKLCGTGDNTGTVPAGSDGPVAPGNVASMPNSLPGGIGGVTKSDYFTPPELPEPIFDINVMSPTVSAMKIDSNSVRIQGKTDILLKTAADNVATSLNCLRVKMDDITDTFNATQIEVLTHIANGMGQFRSMIMSMATSLQTGLVQAANETVPTGTIASMVQIVSDLNNVLQLINVVDGQIAQFRNFQFNIINGVHRLQEIVNLDMDLSVLIPPEFKTLQNDYEQAYYELSTAGSSLSAANRALGTLGDIVGVDTTDSLPTPPSGCP